jgi:FKBP-type peptidyl-prolyl cis-trans isomerase
VLLDWEETPLQGVDLAKEVQQALSSRVPATTAAAPASGQPKAEKSRKKKKKKNKEQEDKKAKKKSKKKSKKQPAWNCGLKYLVVAIDPPVHSKTRIQTHGNSFV